MAVAGTRSRSRLGPALGWGSLGLSAGLFLASIYLAYSLPAHKRPAYGDFVFNLVALAFSILGAYLAARRETNRVAWMACGIGLGISLAGFGQAYPLAAQYSPPGRYPGARLAVFAGDLGWTTALAVMLIFLPLLFPDGRLLSARWKPIPWAAGGVLGLMTVADAMGELNPDLRGAANGLIAIASAGLLPLIFIAIGSLVLRYRRAGSVQRLQMKWFIAAAILVGLVVGVLAFVNDVLHADFPLSDLVTGVAYLCLPFGIAIAVLKYRLYEIDLIINRALVYGALAVFITTVYVAVVVGIGALIRSRGQFNLGLSILATAMVAVAFQPVRERVQRLANHLVYGKRATPYEVMADFSERMSETLSPDEVLPRMAEAAARGVGADASRVSVQFPDGAQRAVWWPRETSVGALRHRVPVSYRDQPVGEIGVAKSPGTPITAPEAKLLSDLAAQAGLVLHNVRLTAELQARLDELSAQAANIRASRQRLVTAATAERQRLEETIRQGVERELAGLAQRLVRVDQALDGEPLHAAAILEALTADVQRTLDALRQLAHGIYPPLLRDKGLAAALQSQVARSSTGATIDTDGIGRYPSELEAAIYFCCTRALDAASDQVRIRLRQVDDVVEFSLTGFSVLNGRRQDMEDRIQAVGGNLVIERGSLVGRVPVRMPEAVA